VTDAVEVKGSGPAGGLPAGLVFEDWTGDARFFEYTRAANPVVPSLSPPVPIRSFPASLHQGDTTRIIPLDLADALAIDDGPATSPALVASFIQVLPGEQIATAPVATSELYHVIRGRGFSVVDGEAIEWGVGDTFALPADATSTHHATDDAALYWVTDEPLLRHLGVAPTTRKFAPTMFTAARARAELDAVAADPRATDRNRLSVLLAGAAHPRTLTATHVLWAMYGLLPDGAVQRPHRHQSVALDLILDCAPGCYSLLGSRLDEHGEIIDPTRVDWEPGGAFVTPPGLWHAHVNESGAPAHLFPVQDAGLQAYLRSLDIRFTAPRR
jgi:gentisate 1,2-dioxygenase